MSDDDDDPPSPFPFEPHLKKARYIFNPGSSSSFDEPRPCCSKNLPSSSEDSSPGERSRDEDAPCKMVIAWRAHHLAKAVFDNTVNTMIENLSFPLPEFGSIMDGYSSARSNNNLEDQAVRMAIRSHGLQKPCSCSRPRNTPHVPCYSIPFHHRTDTSIFGGPSTSSASLRQPESVEQDILSEAVNVAILNKGLGASHGSI